MTKKQTILKYLQTHKKGLTSKEAYDNFGETRLSATVWSLKNDDGWDIKKTSEKVPTRYGRNTSVTRYRLEV